MSKNETVAEVLGGVPAVKEESRETENQQEVLEVLCCSLKVPELHPVRARQRAGVLNGIRHKGHAGKTLSDFAEHPFAKGADLDPTSTKPR